MFIVFYTVNWYICEFVTCFTSCCLNDTLMNLCNVCMYEYLYVGMWERIHLCETPHKTCH